VARAERPNFLVITTDQQRGDCLGVAGRNVHTPHLDRLAGRGTRFANCMTASPICQPSRASILTGRLPLTHGVRDNGIDLEPDEAEKGFAARLSRDGYRTGFVGKAHFSTKLTFAPTGRPECRSSSADYDEDWHGPYMGFDHVELMLGTMTEAFPPLAPPAGQHFERWFAPRREEALALWETRVPPHTGAPQTWTSALPGAWHPTTWVAERAAAFLKQAGGGSGEPFCLWASIPDPHHPFDCPLPWARLHAPEDVEVPLPEMPDAARPWWYAAAREGAPAIADPVMRAFRSGKSRMPKLTPAQTAQMVSNYYGMIAFADDAVGRMLTALAMAGLADNTIVVFLSDHGDLLGDHGLTLKGPMLVDGLIRVPLIAAGPGIVAGQTVDTPVSTIDLAPTLAELAGLPTADDAQGTSLAPMLAGGESERDPVFTEWRVDERRFGRALDLRCVRTATAKLIVERNSGDGELYDLENDPDEMRNVFDDPACAHLRREMLALIDRRPGVTRTTFAEPVGMS